MSETPRTEQFARVPVWLALEVSPNAVKLFTIIAGVYASHKTDRAEKCNRKQLAADMEKSLDTVDRAKAELVKAGAIEVEQRFQNGARLPDAFRIYYGKPGTKGGRTLAATPETENAVDEPDGGRNGAATPSPHECGEGGRTSAEALRDSELPSEETSNEVSSERSEKALRICEVFGQLLRADGENASIVEGKVTNPNWLDAAEALFDEDERDPYEAERLLRWSQHDGFWRSRILSMNSFRGNYRALRVAAERDGLDIELDRSVTPPPALAAITPEDWQRIREIFADRYGEDIDDIWISQLWPVGLSGTELWIGGHDRARGWVELKYGRVLTTCADSALGTEITAIRFAAISTPPETEQPLEKEPIHAHAAA